MNGELKLLPCPFCGGQPTLMFNSIVECRSCPTGKYSGYVSADITAWNRRPTPAPGALPELPLLQFAVFDEFGKGADDRVQDYGQKCHDAGRAYAEQCRAGVWLPIETAPKDGTRFLAHGEPRSGMGHAAHQTYWKAYGEGSIARRWFQEGKGPEGAFWYHEFDWTQGWHPTHWMPLPAPPALQSSFADDEGVKRG